jgi:TatD DNase family protein
VIDTHAHLDALEDPSAAVHRARDAGVDAVVAIGSGIESARETIAIAQREVGVYPVVGIHPHQAADGDSIDELWALAETQTFALGEIGLDYFRDYAPRDDQRRVFAAQLELAREHGFPVVIHTRAAEADTMDLLRRFDGTVVLHCFSAPELLLPALERDYYVSFAGNVTYPKADDLREAAAQVPADRLLVETDAPYLAPQPVRGRTNEPAHVVHTVAALAETRGEDAAELGELTAANAVRAFALPR